MTHSARTGLLAAVCALWLADAAMPQDRPAPLADDNGDYRFRFVDAGGTPREFVLVPAGKIEPAFEVAVAPLSNGFRYTYVLRNGAGARQRLRGCALDVSLPTVTDAAPSGWEGAGATVASPRVGWWMVSTRDDGTMDGIRPGETHAGFRLTSPNLPGVTEARCLSNHSPTVVDPSSLPAWVVREIDRILPSSKRNDARTPAIAPLIAVSGRPLAAVVSAITMAYSGPFATSAHPNRPMILSELRIAADAAARLDRRGVHRAYSRLQELVGGAAQDRWALELDKGLTTCVGYVLASLEDPQ